MKVSLSGFAGAAEKIRSSEIYDVHDLKFLRNLTVSMTLLHPGRATNGHSHEGKDEVYVFLEGSGEMQLGGERFAVASDDVVLVNGGTFHRVFNTAQKEMRFLCVFEPHGGR